MIVCSNREVKFQLEQLHRATGALKLTEWEENFIEDCKNKDFTKLSEKQKRLISKIYFDRKDSAS